MTDEGLRRGLNQLRSAMAGQVYFDRADVESLLDSLIPRFAELVAENAALRKALATLEEEIPHGGEGWAGKQEREVAVVLMEQVRERARAELDEGEP